jgi:hypothetical protein
MSLFKYHQGEVRLPFFEKRKFKKVYRDLYTGSRFKKQQIVDYVQGISDFFKTKHHNGQMMVSLYYPNSGQEWFSGKFTNFVQSINMFDDTTYEGLEEPAFFTKFTIYIAE